MRKFLLKILLYLIITSLITFLLAKKDNADKYTNSDHNVLKIAHMSDFDSLNILFLGNSYCYSSIYCPLFDSLHIRALNLGVATAGPAFYSLLLQSYLSSVRKKPDTVMLLVSPMTFSTQADDWKDYPIHRYLKHPMSNERIAVKYAGPMDYVAMVINSVRKGMNNIFSRQSQLNKEELSKMYAYKGLFIDSTVTSDSLEKSIDHLFAPLRKDHFDEKASKTLMRVADKLDARGIKVIFFEAPTNHLNKYFSPNFLSSYEKFCQTLSTRYLLLRNHLQLNSRYFRNTDHTNTQGAYVFTSHLITDLFNHQMTANNVTK